MRYDNKTNSKLEILNPKQTQNSKLKCSKQRVLDLFRISILGFSICFSVFAQPATVTPKGLTNEPGLKAGTTPVAEPAAEPTAPADEGLKPSATSSAEAESAPAEELVYLNVQDSDIKEVIKQISKATGRNFIIDDKVRGKVTIISERPMTREEAFQTFLSALEVAGFTIVKGPAGVIKIIPLKDAVQEPIPTHVDTTPVTDMFITRLIPLQNISAVDMSNAIKGLVSREGNLFAYPATNTLIITDSGTNIDRLMKIIKELDQEGPQQVLEIISVHNASARDIAQMVNQLFESQKSGVRKPGKKAGELEEMEEVSKIIPDERTNAIIVLASKRAIEKVRNIIKKLDHRLEEGQEGRIHVYALKHAKAKDMSATLSTLTAVAGAKKDASAGPIVAEFEGGMKITADEATNSLIITSTPKDYQTLIDKVISKLDVPRRQVYLESVVMELSMSREKQFGLAGGFGGGTKGPLRIFGADPYSGLLSGFLSGSPTLPTGLLGGLIGRDSLPITVGNETRNIPSIGVFFSALSGYGDANIISTPNILTLDNEEATIEVKEKEYYQGNPTFTAAGLAQYSTQPAEAGLTLKIKPQIGEGDNVSMKIEQSLSGFTRSASANLPPPTKERKISTSVVTMDGQTVVLGGLMEDKVTNSKQKIPLLGDIPIIGNLFKHTAQSKKKVNLLIFITPHVVKDSTDFTNILKRKIEDRNRFIDENFGKKQREAIRASIKSHREDLLEFKAGDAVEKAPVSAPPAQPVTIAPVITAPPQGDEYGVKKVVPAKPVAAVKEEPYIAPVAKTPSAPSAAPSPPPAAATPSTRVKAPVITVPPPAPGARGDELDLAY